MGRHRLTLDWANQPYVVFVEYDGEIVRSAYARNQVIGRVGRCVDIGDSFKDGD